MYLHISLKQRHVSAFLTSEHISVGDNKRKQCYHVKIHIRQLPEHIEYP